MWDMRAIASALLPKVEVTPNHGSLILITSFHTQINDQQLEASSERFSERRLVICSDILRTPRRFCFRASSRSVSMSHADASAELWHLQTPYTLGALTGGPSWWRSELGQLIA